MLLSSRTLISWLGQFHLLLIHIIIKNSKRIGRKPYKKEIKHTQKTYAPKYDKYLAGTGLLQLKGHLETNLQAARLQSRMALFGSY